MGFVPDVVQEEVGTRVVTLKDCLHVGMEGGFDFRDLEIHIPPSVDRSLLLFFEAFDFIKFPYREVVTRLLLLEQKQGQAENLPPLSCPAGNPRAPSEALLSADSTA